MPPSSDEPVVGESEPASPQENAAKPALAVPARWHQGALAVGLLVIATLYLFLYLPQLTTVPPVYSDDFILAQAAASFARHGTLEFTINSAPFDDPAILGTAEKNRAFLEEGYFMALGAWFRAVGASITTARLFSCLAGLAYLLLMFLLLSRLAGPLPALAACMLTLLETSFWYTARTVRPDLPTAAACSLGLLLLTIPPPRARWAALLLALTAGLVLGVGSTMHPNWTMWVVPALILLFHRRGLGGNKGRILAVVVGVLLVFTPYVVDLSTHWGEVQKTLHVHDEHTESLEKVSRRDWNWRQHWLVANVLAEGGRYASTAGTDHNAPTRSLLLVVEGVAVAWLALRVGLRRFMRRAFPPTGEQPDHALVLACLATMALVLAATVTYKVPLYLVHVLPWLHLAVALAALDLGAAVVWGVLHLVGKPGRPGQATWREAGAMGGLVLVGLLLAPYALRTVGDFRATFRGYAQARVLSYEELTTVLARHVPPGSILFSSPNGWPVADKSRSVLISNQMYPYQQVPLPEFPWRYQREGSHLLSYRLDADRLAHLARASSRRIFFMTDEFDWAWHGFYPFGARYGASYSQLQEDLDHYFRPVAEIVTGPRGQVRLFEYRGSSPPVPSTAGTPALYLEGQRLASQARTVLDLDGLRALLRAAPGPARQAGTMEAPSRAATGPVHIMATEQPLLLVRVPGARGHVYRITLRARALDGAVLYPVFAGVPSTEWRALRLMDSPSPITYTHYLACQEAEMQLFLQFLGPRGQVELEECRVEELWAPQPCE